MRFLFSATLFLSAFLLFVVQPMAAKMLLPVLGGSPAVWTTCMLFFQSALLAGYLYAHMGARLPAIGQSAGHVGMLALGFIALGLQVDHWATPDSTTQPIRWLLGTPNPTSEPIRWLLGQLAGSIGLPFALLAGSAPMLQRWFAAPDRDPYFLYAASNAGSLAGLAAFPFVLEPLLDAEEQARAWMAGYGLLVVLTGVSAWASRGRQAPVETEVTSSAMRGLRLPLALSRRLHWALLAFIPSSLMLGVTATITADIAAVPLLWVIPLGLYLLSFILVFRDTGPALSSGSRRIGARLLPAAILVGLVALLAGPALISWPLVPLHWAVLFVVALACHGQLADDRPEADRLTEFYLWLAVGGVLGGLFNVLAAPLLFRGSYFEYPLMLLLAGLFRPGPGIWDSPSPARWLDLLLPVLLGTAALTLTLGLHAAGHPPGPWLVLAMLGGVAAVCGSFAARPTRFTLGLMALSLVRASPGSQNEPLAVERNFFGIVRVQEVRDHQGHRYRQLVHGSTIHGRQRIDDEGYLVKNCEALTYFHSSGPVGQIFDAFRQNMHREVTSGKRKGWPLVTVAVAGLGIGSLAAYRQEWEDWTFFEIDEAVVRMAHRGHFTFLDDHGFHEIVYGDARIRLHEEGNASFDLIILDAFSSDSVPVHLLTREALAIYRKKLAPGGILAFNITNRYLDLRPVLADLAREAGWLCYARRDDDRSVPGKEASHWLVMAEKAESIACITEDPRWVHLPGREGARVWTDRFSNLASVLRWGRD